ncbi:MAG: winged helix-turn-helix domain-containing protein [Flavobacteriales bacterium]
MPQPSRPAPRIRRSRRRLTEEQEIQAQLILRSRLAEDGGAWTRAKAHALTSQLARIELPDRTFSAYLERWGFAAEKPLRTAHKADPFGMKAWMAIDYPIIAMQARETGSEILWLGMATLPTLRNSRGLEIRNRPETAGDHLLFVTTNRGDREWVTLEYAPTAGTIINFLDLIVQHDRSIDLIVPDILPFKEASSQRWLQRQSRRVNIHALPVVNRSINPRR